MSPRFRLRRPSGYTLIEIIIVIGIISILVGLIFLVVNPEKRLTDSRNAKRRAEVDAIAKSASVHLVRGNAIPGLTETMQMIGTSPDGCQRRCGDLNGISEEYAYKGLPTTFVVDRVFFKLPTANTPSLNLNQAAKRTFSAWVRLNRSTTFNGVLTKFDGAGYAINVGTITYYDSDLGYVRLLQGGDGGADSALIDELEKAGKANVALFLMDNVWVHTISTTNFPIQAGKYHHIAVRYDGSTSPPSIDIFVDGVKQNIATNENVVPLSFLGNYRGSNSPFTVGAGALPLVGPYSYGGRIDDLAVFSRALTDQEIERISDGEDAEDINLGSNGVAWHFNEGTGQYAAASNADPNYILGLNDTLPPGKTYDDFWANDEPLLPDECYNLTEDVPGLSSKLAAPGTKKFTPTTESTFYAVAYSGSVIARSCLAEEENGELPEIEAAR